MPPTHHVENIDALRQVEPKAGEAILVLGYYTSDDGGGGIFRADTTSGETDNQGTIIAPNSPYTGRWKRVYSGPLSVKFFGARNDLPHDPHGTRLAIQAAINFAINPSVQVYQEHPCKVSNSYAVVTFPATTHSDHGALAEYQVDGPIVLPRLPYSYIVLRGDGQRASTITRVNAGPLFICDQNPDNKNNGCYLIEHLCLTVQPPPSPDKSPTEDQQNCRAFDWTPPVDGDFSRPEIHFNEVLFASGSNPIVGLVHIKRGDRCRFYNCEFTGLNTFTTIVEDGNTIITGIGKSGVAIWLEHSGGTTIINSRIIRTGGALLKCSGSGELMMINCRSEGAIDIPDFDFQDSEHITLIGLATEGLGEHPALFRFTNCRNVVAIHPGLAGLNRDSGKKPCHGMLFENCSEFTVIQPVTRSSFTQWGEVIGDYSSRAIYIDKDCRYGVVRGLYCNHIPSDTDIGIESEAQDCFVEAFSTGRGGLVGIGTVIANSLRGSPAFAPSSQPPTYPPTHPQGYDLEIGGGDGGIPGTDLAGNTVIQFGQPDAAGNTAQLLFRQGEDPNTSSPTNFGRIWYAGSSMNIDSLGAVLRLRHNSSTRMSLNRTGIAFNGNPPVAKPTVTGSHGGNSALQSLLSALDKLGLVRDGTNP